MHLGWVGDYRWDFEEFKKKDSCISGEPREKDKGHTLRRYELIVNAIGSERSIDEIILKYMWYFRFDCIREDGINKLERYELGSSTLELFSIYGFYLQR